MIWRSPSPILFLASLGLFILSVVLSWAVYPFVHTGSYSLEGTEDSTIVVHAETLSFQKR